MKPKEIEAKIDALRKKESSLLAQRAMLKKARAGDLNEHEFTKNVETAASVEAHLKVLPEMLSELEELLKLEQHNEFMATVPVKAEAVRKLAEGKKNEMSRLLHEIGKLLDRLDGANQSYYEGYREIIGGPHSSELSGVLGGYLAMARAPSDAYTFRDLRLEVDRMSEYLLRAPRRAELGVFDELLPDDIDGRNRMAGM